MVRRLTALYPFLFAAVYVLYLAWQSPGYFELGDLLLILAVVLAGTGVIYLVSAAIFRNRADGRLPALVTFLILLSSLGFPFVFSRLDGLPRSARLGATALAAIAAIVLLVRWLARRPGPLQTVATLLTLTGTLLLVRFGVAIGAARISAAEEVEESSLAHALERPIAGPAVVPGPRRDIYLIVLDEYANSGVLRDRFGYDNRAFEDSLRALGFYVPPVVGSNYVHTILSLPSLLNSAHVYPVARELPEGPWDPTLVHLLEWNRVAPFLQERGYEYVFFPSLWWASTRRSGLADSVVNVWPGFDLSHALSRTELRRTVRGTTILRFLHRSAGCDADYIRRTLEGMGQLPRVDRPVFAFAHLISPHKPYVFDRNCRTPSRSADTLSQETAYIEQVQCLNSLVLGTVTEILRRSDVPPVILLQGDHGTSTLKVSDAPTAAEVDPEAAGERFGAFGAYYLPDSGATTFGDTVTVVNVLGNVLRHYFGAKLPPEPDDRYVSPERTPFEFSRGNQPAPASSSSLERTPRASHPEESGSLPSAPRPSGLRGRS